MELHYLDFDISEDADGSAVFDAMATVSATQLKGLWAEVSAVLGWGHRHFPGARAPLEDGGDWDFQLDGARAQRFPQTLAYDESSGAVNLVAELPAGPSRHSVTLSISGSPAFSEAFREVFGIA